MSETSCSQGQPTNGKDMKKQESRGIKQVTILIWKYFVRYVSRLGIHNPEGNVARVLRERNLGEW